MSIDARPTSHVHLRPHPSHAAATTEGPSALLADDALADMPGGPLGDPEELELPEDIELQTLSPDEFDESLRAQELEHESHEVDDTPADDALIAEARISRFEEAHRGATPVDVGPWEEP